MAKLNFVFRSGDGTDIYVYKWEPDDLASLKGAVQLVHGMVEHAGRYEHFAKELTGRGYVVYANDHRGHGKTAADEEELGHLDAKGGWNNLVADVHQLSLIIKKENPELPLFLFGHSMGSFIARDYISKYGKLLKGVIICGSGYTPGMLVNFGLALSKREIRKFGQKHRSEFINKIAFSSNNKKFEPAKTEFDWLSRDAEVVNNYIQDKLCGGVCTAGFYINLFRGLKEIQAINTVSEIPKELPIFIISGKDDPVGSYGSAAEKLYKSYKKVGIKEVNMKIYNDCRHELLNEINRDEIIIEDIIGWINERNHF